MDEKILKVLEEIKRLTILGLIERGVPSKDIAIVLKVDPAVISRLVPRKSR